MAEVNPEVNPNNRFQDTPAYNTTGINNRRIDTGGNEVVGGVPRTNRRRGDMTRFRVRYPTKAVDTDFVMQEASTFIEVDVYRCTNTVLMKDGNLKAGKINLIYSGTELDITREERAALVIAYIGNIFISEQTRLTAAMAGIGIKLNWIDLPSNDPGMPPLDDENVDIRLAAIQLGLAVMFLYKNVDNRGYDQYLASRVAAMASRVAIDIDARGGMNIFRTIEDAAGYRSLAGNTPEIKKIVINAVISGTEFEGAFGEVCRYLFNILSWTDMTSLVFIHETLLVTKSPVLTRPEVQAEVLALDRAFSLIHSSTYPQYFRIQAPSHYTGALERAKFRVLLEVARRIRGVSTQSAFNFAREKNILEPQIQALVNLHKSYYAQYDTRNLIRKVNNLTENEDDFEEEEAEFSMLAERRPQRVISAF